MKTNSSVSVFDDFGAVDDPALPFLKWALDPEEAGGEIQQNCASWAKPGVELSIRTVRVLRHKPGRRCLIEYDVELASKDSATRSFTILGKVKAKRLDRTGHEVLSALWKARFETGGKHGMQVPEPLGVVPGFHMTLQMKAPGQAATGLLLQKDGVELGRRIAEAAHDLHCTVVPTPRCHRMEDELRILQDRLSAVCELRPEWCKRIERILRACEPLGASVPQPGNCGIHRDFYPAQVLVDGPKLWLVDFDLYCLGDPALDIGNFIGHLTEQSLRTLSDPLALRPVERALEDRFVELTGEVGRGPVRAYAALTLVRHIYLSTQFPERRHLTEALLKLSEERLRDFRAAFEK